MTTFGDLPRDGWLRRLRPRFFLMLLGVALAGCGSSSSDSPQPAPPAPPPPPAATVPPVSSTVIDVEDGHTVGAQQWANGNTSTGGQGQPIGTMECRPPNRSLSTFTLTSPYS